MTGRVRLLLAAAVTVLAMVGAVLFVVLTKQDQERAKANAPALASHTDVATVAAEPHLVFRNTALGEGYGRIALVPLSAPQGSRALTPASCDRVYATRTNAICLAANRGLVTTYRSTLLGPDWAPARDLPSQGLPSRARLSRDGSVVATTTFVYGDSYAAPGQFSTRTLITRADSSEDLEDFELFVNGPRVTAADSNLWGVTFADNDRFYATAAAGGKTWLVEGSVSRQTMEALRGDVECPSLSPDGTRIAFKKHGDLPPDRWRLAIYNLRTGTETLLAETRSVDDQVEWLDNERILYGLPREAQGTASSDIWVVRADGTGIPEVFVADAWSPAVVR